MIRGVDNYKIQAAQAKQLFLTYDQQELIQRCHLRQDADYFYIRFFASPYRICRHTGDMQRWREEAWVDANSFQEVMTILDWLCDSKPDRCPTGRWINVVSHCHSFHSNLQEDAEDPVAALFETHAQAFADACRALGGEKVPWADMAFAFEMVDGLGIMLQLWYGDEEFPARLRCLWDENVLQYIRYETTWYAVPLLIGRIKEEMRKMGCTL